MNTILYGLEFGIGFFGSFSIFIFFILRKIRRSGERSMRRQLTLEMLQAYREKLDTRNEYEEANEIKDYIVKFKNREPMDDFFQKYKIGSRLRTLDESEEDLDDEENLFGSFKRVYFIKQRF